jgi:hypothetical protein
LISRTLTVFAYLFCSILGWSIARAENDWQVSSHPYRIQLRLSESIEEPTAVAVDINKLLEKLRKVSVDQLNEETFAFERGVVVNPHSGKAIGRFELVREDKPFDVDGDYAKLQQGNGPWIGFSPAKMKFDAVQIGEQTRTALMIEEQQIANAKLYQPVKLEPGRNYLLEYWIMMEAKDNEMDVMIHHPEHRLFSQAAHSYVNRLPPEGKWTKQRMLFRPQESTVESDSKRESIETHLQISHAFIGRGGVADLQLQPVAWKLAIEPDEPVEEVHLYGMARAGHRLAVPTDEILGSAEPRESINCEFGEAERQDLNEDAIIVSNGELAAWTVDPALPLKVGAITTYRPESPRLGAVRINCFPGGSTSVLIAVNSNTPRLKNLTATADLPCSVTFHRLATIPVYDGPTVQGELKGKLIETRYDAMVPLDYKLDPDSTDGHHLIVATVTPTEDMAHGKHSGHVELNIDGETLSLPVELRVSSLVIKPKRHFGSLFGAVLFNRAAKKGEADMAEDAVSIASFHGLEGEDLIPHKPTFDSGNDTVDVSLNVRELAEHYFHTLLDNHLLPRCPDLYLSYNYEVVERGPELAPELKNWDFSNGFDQAIKEFVIDRDMPWFTVFHSNGHLMHMLRLGNGTTYSIEANPGDPNWIQLPREEFDKLVGDFFDAVAKHLDELGILDRAIFVIDESGFETYGNIFAYVTAMKSRPYAKRIKIGHTSYKVSTWTHRLPNGKLLMDEVLDVPMPINDEHFNFFEPEWGTRFEKPKTQWVYHVESDHLNLENAGLSSIFLPLKLAHFGVSGWYDWESFMWSLPYAYLPGERGGFKYGTGPVTNPWINPFYHHGPGVLSFFYPPAPRGPANVPTDLVIPSFRLTLMRDGIQERSLLEVLQAGRDDGGKELKVNKQRLAEAQTELDSLWPDNPVQWYLGYDAHAKARRVLYDLAMESATP